MYIFRLFIILTILSSILFSTTLENGSSKKIDKWSSLKYFSKGTIKNIYDKRKKSRVIKFDGNGTRSVYILRPKNRSFKLKKGEDTLEWEMNYNEDFVILIELDTLKGKRYLIYTSGDRDSYLQYGLGKDSISGEWKKYSRKLQEDLEKSDRYNRIISVNSFVIKGSGVVDNIKIIKSKQSKSTPVPTILEKSEKIEQKIIKIDKKAKENKIKIDKSTKITQPPIIYLKGSNPMILKKGEAYIEPGATAKNRDGSNVEITISGDIDILKDGEYSVIYMATNSAGHTAFDRRRVVIGNFSEDKKRDSIKDSSKNNSIEVPSDKEVDDIDLEQRALEILEWEKQLAQREQELENSSNIGRSSLPKENYPSRPGL